MSSQTDEERLAAVIAAQLGAQLDRALVNPDWEAEDRILAAALFPLIYEAAVKEYKRWRSRLQ